MIRVTQKRLENRKFVVDTVDAYWQNKYKPMKDVAKEIGVSTHAISECIRVAGIKNWISFQKLCDIKEKEHNLQSKYIKNGRARSDRVFEDEIFPARRQYIKTHLTEEICSGVTSKYIANPTDKEVYKLMGLSRLEMEDVVLEGHKSGLISDETFQTLCSISISKNKENEFTTLEERMKAKREALENAIAERRRKLDGYEDIYSDGDEAPSKESIDREIKDLEAQLAAMK